MVIQGISIVICTYNGESRLAEVLESIFLQDQNESWELIIIDNASTDNTRPFVNSFFKTNDQEIDWKLIYESNPGLNFARMRGLIEAKYPYVLFCDDDNVLFPDFLSNALKLLDGREDLGVLGSHGIPQLLGEKPDWFDRYAHSFAVGPQKLNQSKDKLKHVYGACSIYLKDPLLSLFQNGFMPALTDRKGGKLVSGGDVEWCWLMQFMGFQIAYSDKLKFFHQIPESRLSWAYYLRLKEGISSSIGLLFTYKLFYEQNINSEIRFEIKYLQQLVKAVLVFTKHILRLGIKPKRCEDQLSVIILKSQVKSYLSKRKQSKNHFKQILNYFEGKSNHNHSIL
jgi:glycosyltransferase involved in cell wall biosynthesis